MKGWGSTCINTGMTYRRYRWQVVYETVVKGVALVRQAPETIGTEAVIIAREIVPAHLIYHNTHDEFWSFVPRWLLSIRCSAYKEQK